MGLTVDYTDFPTIVKKELLRHPKVIIHYSHY